MAGTTIGGLRVDLQLNSAAFIRDIAKTNAAIAKNTRAMSGHFSRLQASANRVGAAFGAWLTVRTVKKVISFLNDSIDLASKLETQLGKAAKAWAEQGEVMSNAFQLGVAQGFLDQVTQAMQTGGASLTQFAQAGMLVGRTLGWLFQQVVTFLTVDVPAGVRASLDGLNSLIDYINSAIEGFNAINDWFNTSMAGKALGFNKGDGAIPLIPKIDAKAIQAGAGAWNDYGKAVQLAGDAAKVTESAIKASDEAAKAQERTLREQERLWASIATPMEQYAIALKAIAAAHAEGELAARLHQAAAADLAGNYLTIADNVATALGTAFQDSKAVAIAQAVINTAQAITKTFAEYGATPWGFALAASMAAIGAAQVAAIVQAQPGSGSTATKSGKS